jgi:predicted DCC family thiol-disulfide oxidoreductase YuxK
VTTPVLVYDGACEFCLRWVRRWQARTGDRVTYVPSRGLESVQLVTAGGEHHRGADAVFRTLAHAPELCTVARIGRFPVLRRIAQAVYAAIAAHRQGAGRIDRWLFGTDTTPSESRIVRDLYMRGLGAVYFVAFASLGAQVKGLYGRRGIRPIAEYLDALRERLAPRERMWRVPTIFWFDASDAALVRACRAGQAAAVMLMLGIAPRAMALVLWLLYLSFVSVGRELLAFQWDGLLLENGLHAIAIAPSKRGERPPWSTVALMRWLAFRLQFESGHCKLASRDRAWRSGAACCVHFETQPLPTRIGWHAHQAPRSLKRAATYAAVAIELVVPWLAFAPRRLRRSAFALLTGLQLLIAATGNYGFFNLLTIVDDLWLLDDAVLAPAAQRGPRARWWQRLASALAAIPIVAVSSSLLIERLFSRARTPRILARIREALAPLRSIHPYGLFAVMTMDRPEIVIEGSDDGVTWRPYELRYKPGDLQRAPRWAAPHQPRLDWQMWFAALGPAPPWFLHLLHRLLEGSPDVLALLAHDPFSGRAPKYVRALLYDYHMTDRETRRRSGAWWRRELLGTYVPAISIDEISPRPTSTFGR